MIPTFCAFDCFKTAFITLLSWPRDGAKTVFFRNSLTIYGAIDSLEVKNLKKIYYATVITTSKLFR